MLQLPVLSTITHSISGLSHHCVTMLRSLAEAILKLIIVDIGPLVSLTLVGIIILLIVTLIILKHTLRLIQPKIKFQEMGINGPEATGLTRQAHDFRNKGVVEMCRILVSEYPRVCGVHYYGTPYILINDVHLITSTLHWSNHSIHTDLIRCAQLWSRKPSSKSVYKPTLGSFYTLNINWLIEPSSAPVSLPPGNIFFEHPERELEAIEQMASIFHFHNKFVLEEVTDSCRLKSDIEIAKVFDQFALQSCISLFTGKTINLIKGESNELSRSIARLFKPRVKQALFSQYELLSSYYSSLNPYFWNQFSSKRRRECVEFDHALAVFGKIALHRNFHYSVVQYDDLLTAAISSHKDKNINLENDEVKLNCFGLFLACYYSISHILTSTVYLLAMNPDKQTILNKKVAEFFLDDPDRLERSSFCNELDEIPYLTNVLQESIRLYPPCAWTTMSSIDEIRIQICDLDSCKINKGCEVLLPFQAAYTAEHNWEDPYEFRPERFSSLCDNGVGHIDNDTTYSPMIACYTNHAPHSALITEVTLTGIKSTLISILAYFKFERTIRTKPYQTETTSVFGNVLIPTNDLVLHVSTT